MSPHQPKRCRLLALSFLLLFCAAPTPGDIGSCGQTPTALDAGRFFSKKDAIDCAQCGSCRLRTQACSRACASGNGAQTFPAGCVPLVHDGQVCLHALEAANCESYARYVREVVPEVPTECNFCPAQ